MTRAYQMHTGLYQEASRIGEELSPRARNRLVSVKLFLKLRERGFASREACETVGISRATLYRWVNKFENYGPYALEPNSTKPRNLRVNKWHKDVLQAVLSLRREFPAWGKSKFFILLKRKGFTVSESTIGRILKYLIEKGKCHRASIFRKNGKHRRRVTRWHAVRIRERLQPKLPGEVIQVDSMTVNLTGFGFKQFTATCPISKWTFLGVSKQATSLNAARFLRKIIKESPFPIRGIQVDGGSEFMKHFEEECATQEIPLYVLPPRSPKLNGNVERANGLCRREFYEAYDMPYSLQKIKVMLREFQHIFNHLRPHFSLKGLTPYENFYGKMKTEAFVSNVLN
tara:strand:+ start:135 stop:1163 length:1029 start_codon:yes stop_codon:yes gene_type:complete